MQLCIERLATVLKNLADQNIESDWVNPESKQELLVVDGLNGTARFNYIAEVQGGSDVVVFNLLFPELQGDPADVKAAYEMLLNYNGDGHGVTIGRDKDSGAIGAMVTFKCQTRITLLEQDVLHYMNILTTFLETHYDEMLRDLGERGVLPQP